MNCGYENPDNATVCVVCNDALTKGVYIEMKNDKKSSNNTCFKCYYPLLNYINYHNCPNCSLIFNQKAEEIAPLPEQTLSNFENIEIKINLNAVLFAELKISKGQIIFTNPEGNQHKKQFRVSEMQSDDTKILKYNKTYGKRKNENSFNFEKNDIIEIFSKNDNISVEINFK